MVFLKRMVSIQSMEWLFLIYHFPTSENSLRIMGKMASPNVSIMPLWSYLPSP